MKAIDDLTVRFQKMVKPSKLSEIGSKASKAVPVSIKDKTSSIVPSITSKAKNILPDMSEKEIFLQAMEILENGFKTLEEQAARLTLSERSVLQKVNKIDDRYSFNSVNELCVLRSYELEKIVQNYKTKDIALAAVEGGSIGAFGFWGIPFNLVLSTFLYFRAVQSVAMLYGYDVKNEGAELVIASEVFLNAMNPSASRVGNEQSSTIYKVMLMGQAAAVQQAAKKGWTNMAQKGGVPLLLAQMRALANKSAQKALNNAGQKGLENILFKEVFEQIGRKLTLKTIGKAVPVVSAAIGALIDKAQMKQVLEYADVFYQKRFILEKSERVHELIGYTGNTIDSDFMEIDDDGNELEPES